MMVVFRSGILSNHAVRYHPARILLFCTLRTAVASQGHVALATCNPGVDRQKEASGSSRHHSSTTMDKTYRCRRQPTRPSGRDSISPMLIAAVAVANMCLYGVSAFMIFPRTRSSNTRCCSSRLGQRAKSLPHPPTNFRLSLRRRRGGTFSQARGCPTMLFEKRPEELALGDRLVKEERPGRGNGGSGAGEGGVALEPPGFLKRLFSVPKNVRRTVAAGDVVVPVIGARDGWGGIRQNLVNRGVYPGVEYRILEVNVESTAGNDMETAGKNNSSKIASLASAREAPEGAFDGGELIFKLRPVYPLVRKLERPWPVQVPAREFPVLLTPFAYNAATAWAALTTSLTTLSVGFVLSQALTFSVIPSHSMEPTLQVNDVILVEKVSRSFLLRRNDIVFFNPPPPLRKVVADAGGVLNSRDLFVKRIAAVPGDLVSVNTQGRVNVDTGASARISQQRLPSDAGSDSRADAAVAVGSEGGQRRRDGGCGQALAALPDSVLQRIRVTDDGEVVLPGAVFVLGDNPAASMDSRVWGQLDQGEIVGHALLRIFPLKAFGLLP